MSERTPNILDKRTLIPIGAALGLAYGVFVAGGIYADFQNFQKLEIPKKFDEIQGKMAKFSVDLALIKGRLGITVSDDLRANIDPTSARSRTMLPPQQWPPVARQYTVEQTE